MRSCSQLQLVLGLWLYLTGATCVLIRSFLNDGSLCKGCGSTSPQLPVLCVAHHSWLLTWQGS